MWVYENDTALSVFIVDLTKDRDVQDNLPCNFLSVRNDSSLIAHVYLNSKKVGSIQAYSADSFIGKDFEVIMIKQPDENNFGINELFLQVGKNEQMSSMPYNPSWDLMEENIDVYASGCDSRISLSTVNTLEKIKYWINVQNSKIVQRRLSVQGSASLGTYAITFDTETIISGGVPINGEVLDTKQYKKIIQNSEFDYSVTNAVIQGWLIDYLLNPNDVSSTYTIVTGTDAVKAYDNDLSTAQAGCAVNQASNTIFEVSFPEISISKVHTLLYGNTAGGTGTYYLDGKVNSSWVNIFTGTMGTTFVYKYLNDIAWNQDKVTGFRLRLSMPSGTYCVNIYDLSTFE